MPLKRKLVEFQVVASLMFYLAVCVFYPSGTFIDQVVSCFVTGLTVIGALVLVPSLLNVRSNSWRLNIYHSLLEGFNSFAHKGDWRRFAMSLLFSFVILAACFLSGEFKPWYEMLVVGLSVQWVFMLPVEEDSGATITSRSRYRDWR